MTTKNTGIDVNRGIYDSPFDAFTNYMNILGDFISRVNSLFPVDMDSEELNSLITTIKNQGDEITLLNKEIDKLQAKLEKLQPKDAKATAKKATTKKAKAAEEPKEAKPKAEKAPVAKAEEKPAKKAKK
jgi:alpha-amylase